MKPTKVLILAGRRSAEHDVSVASARSVVAAATQSTCLEVTSVIITREGRWLSVMDSERVLKGGAPPHGGSSVLDSDKVIEGYNVVFPLTHGPFGEDGTMQGMLELAGLPYVGSGVLASALCMDKCMTREVLRANGIPQVHHLSFTRHGFKEDPEAVVQAVQKLTPPWFVKPANLGSSAGVSKVRDVQGLRGAIEEALRLGRRIIIEEGVHGVREFEVAVLGNDVLEASPVGEIIHGADFYDYRTKYTDGEATLRIPTDAPPDVCKKIQELAMCAYRLLDCAGFARVDFFYQAKSGQLFLNEINTIPGFTSLSMFPRLWEAGGIAYGVLIEKLVSLAIARHREMRR